MGGCIHGLTEESMKDNIMVIRSMGKGYITGRMEGNMTVNGKMVSSMGKVNTFWLMDPIK